MLRCCLLTFILFITSLAVWFVFSLYLNHDEFTALALPKCLTVVFFCTCLRTKTLLTRCFVRTLVKQRGVGLWLGPDNAKWFHWLVAPACWRCTSYWKQQRQQQLYKFWSAQLLFIKPMIWWVKNKSKLQDWTCEIHELEKSALQQTHPRHLELNGSK